MLTDDAVRRKKAAFLKAYGETCMITSAAEKAKIGRQSHYDWLEADPEYKAAFESAAERAVDAMEDEAKRRAMHGVERPVTVAGKKVTIREYSDTLLIFLLKGARPDKYRDRWSGELSGKDGQPLVDAKALESWIRGAPDSE